MANTTFRTFYDVIRELEGVYGHQELWLYSGITDVTPDEVIIARHNWKSPKILKRNGSIVAERIGGSESWQLVGDYKKPQSHPGATPWQSCQIDHTFKGLYILSV